MQAVYQMWLCGIEDHICEKSRSDHDLGQKCPGNDWPVFFVKALFANENNERRMGMGESRLHYGMSLRLYFEEKAFGPGMVMLLREVERTGSLQKAAKNMNMAYSKAWKMLKGAEKEWGFALTDRETGGKDGGGSTLTPQAERLIEAYEGFKKDAVDHLDQLFAQYFSEEKVEKIKGME